jgi:hypothetical protein
MNPLGSHGRSRDTSIYPVRVSGASILLSLSPAVRQITHRRP